MKQNNLMKIKSWVIPLLMVAFLVFVGVGCGGNKQPPAPEKPADTAVDTAEDTVEDTDPAEGELDLIPDDPAEEEDTTPLTGEYQRKSQRDPFIPVVEAPQKNVPKPAVVEVEKPPIDEGPIMPTRTGPVEIDGATVGVQVSGIMAVGGGYQAILTGAGGRSYMVSTGQKLGDYTVSQITRDTVVLTTSDYIARLRLKEDIGSPGTGAKPGQPDDSGPTAPAPPPQ